MISTSEPSDETLMARLQADDEMAMNALIDRWQVPMRRYAFRFIGSEAAATDLAEEVFVRLYTHRHKFKSGSHFTPWLFTIATNLCRNQKRWARRHPSEPLPETEDWEKIAADRGSESSPAERLRQQELIATVRTAIDNLPHELKTVVLLCEYEHLSQAEAGASLGCSTKAVETRLYRARRRLRELLASYFDGSSVAR